MNIGPYPPDSQACRSAWLVTFALYPISITTPCLAYPTGKSQLPSSSIHLGGLLQADEGLTLGLGKLMWHE